MLLEWWIRANSAVALNTNENRWSVAFVNGWVADPKLTLAAPCTAAFRPRYTLKASSHGRERVYQVSVAPDGSPVFTRDIGAQEIYALTVKWP